MALLGFADQADAPPTAGQLQLLQDPSARVRERADALAVVEKTEWLPFAARVTSLR